MSERIILACLGIVFGGMAYIALGYSLRDSLGPGAGFFPFWLGLIGVAMVLGLMVQSFRGKSIEENPQDLLPHGDGARRAAVLLGGLFVAALVLQPLGFRLTMLVFTAGLLLALGVRRPLAIGVFALVASFGLFHVFYYWLQVPLPIGRLGI
jgi:putative tricarboxylic transport membrane protein